ncbi:histidyl-tRNA synthetase [Acetobacter pasteurianus IFO 3283-22]|uniref:Histidine--tRNA ligase n=1 Tax=Acetobacter pasteurianus (strain NBRC 105184 / IFO 3283-01) TaxID=634452 RepID=C7JGS0_ACEP3|nr:histidyl-tRNA synthetase [Acetobacter pasteurianus IFO 3283-01]BAI02332.1 histidyl-tRNA synthetase [Acetobacter pasteurianus IFO 3283-03]BAI05378.1 histidyl-tRNA synthetase [Acetobacter pasteurianus IFO 3283-07]BAI08427.1 histidyl-tRNA synthetase [Acetobacter pasteurianus IFO 3283-22]BAI11475.1 histidyl-tRNA synthetase [Acetobacter pasteurianus IFO 3283-26]BAI14521.1 histidyl-tRNA synthetase [Acetobacter pasteurianus IFO 3283-32]BAI17567.1 histidyl-tRNA synthetase [Acetobacter pasteurianus
MTGAVVWEYVFVSSIQPVRGTHDLIGEDQRRHAHVVHTARRIAGVYGFDEWATPIFEDTRVFSRSLGDTSDVVSKEMYSFSDRDGESLTLRPEGTAAICRALVTNALTQSLPQKVFYAGPMFRHERPQKGRYRQFHQIGAELLGAAEPLADAEAIAMGYEVLKALGIADYVTLELNTLGDAASRDAWRDALVAYFSAHKDKLSEDSLTRLEKNPLRILDSKDAGDKVLVADAPMMAEFLTPEARAFWDDLRNKLDVFGIAYTVNPSIVRGLDYYNHTTFEFVTNRLGSQGTVLAGGRYDGLVKQMGGPEVPAIGWAAGIERLSMLLEQVPAAPRSVVLVPVGTPDESAVVQILQGLRGQGVRTEIGYKGSLRKRMERAGKQNASHVLFLGEDELAKGLFRVKNMETGTEQEVSRDTLLSKAQDVFAA